SIWLAGREYPADEQGAITVPFSTTPGRQSIVISRGDFSCLDSFAHEAENYTLSAGMYVDRESLLSRRQATVLIRPGLRLNGALASVQLLTQPKLLITSTDLDGISTSDQINDVALFDDRETVHEFQVPARTASISFVLTAKVNRVSAGGAPFDLSTVTGFTLNGIEQTDKTEDLHLVPSDTGYVVALLGKTGEPKGGRAIHLSLKHRDFRDLFLTTLKTTPQGRVELGELADITSVTATGPQGMTETWPLRPDRTTSSPQLNGKEGEPVVVPFVPRAEGELSPAEVSLLELRGNAFVADRFRNLKQRDGLLVIEGLPAGNFDLWLKSSDTQIHLRIAAGAKDRRFVLGKTRILETPAMPPLQVAAIEKTPEALKVKLANATKLTRVHVFADRFAPAYSAFDSLASVGTIEPKQFSRLIASSVYITGRNIGDEYSYIFNRKYAAKLPGNMLERPALLLNPWGVRETETGEQQASQADDFAGVDSLRRELEMGIPTDSPASPPPPPGTSQFSNLDFLASGSTVLVNLTADDDGTVTIPLAELGAHQHIHIVAVDALSTAYRSVALPEPDLLVIDQRLLFPLDPEKHFSQQKQISVIAPGTPFEIADVTTSRFETYDSLARVYALFATLSGDTQLAEFGPILTWPTMTPEARRAFYSKHASHELTFFLAKKDPEFFQTVIKPYLANKRDKTFLDHWLLEEDLREYLQPWNFGQLNVVERILVARRIEADRQATARHIADLYSLLPPDRDRFTRLFDTAIKGRALSSNEELEELLSASMEVEPTDETGDALAERQDRGGRVMSSFKSKRSAGLGQGGGMGGGGFFGGGTGRMTVGMGGMPAAPGEMERFSKQLDDVELKQEPVEEQAKSQRGEANERSSLRSKSGAARRKMPQKKFLKESLRDADDSDSDGDEPVSDVAEYLDYDLAITLPTDSIRSLYRQPDPTKEWAENNYHHLTIDEQMSDLITVNAFWRDFAQHDPAQPFVSAHLAEASGTRLTISPAGPAVVYHEEIRAADPAPGPAKILVGQSYFKHGDRHMQVDGEQVDKYVTDEFLIHTVYGCQVVVTNPSSTRQNLSLLLQIPQGAIPVLNTRRTRTQLITLEPYHTQTIDYHFYFPAAGEFQHFPVQVARNADLVAFAAPTTLHVVEKPVKVDAESWDHVSQFGSSEEVVAFLTKQNCDRLDLDRIAWRMNDARFFETVTRLLASRHAYNQTLWSYALKHNAVPAINDLLQHADPLVTECGGRLRSRLLTIDPVARRTYEHLEYKPLVNARAHALGKRRQIVNDRFHQQYHLWLAQAAYDRELSPDDLLTATYYLLLQDRVEEARSTFRRVKPEQIASRMQYDYCAAYLDFFNAEPAQARAIALKYTDHPVDRWRNTFAAIVAQLDEAEGKETQVVDATSRDQQQSQLAATEPSFEFKVEAKEIELSYQNLDQVRVSYYLMDVELLFSRNPFVRQFRGQFSAVKPNQTALVSLKPADAPDEKPASGTMRIPLPKELLNKNILVEITGAGENRTQAYYSHSLGVQVIENYGQVRVTQATTEKPVSKAYVKVYTRTAGGEVKFFKDGYTDLRGRFDYASLSTNDLDGAVKFAILILSDEHGAVVKEADPPKR
ncbi:MAG: hypothetical protein NT069_12045, partial [Planctomycetota bacterium]|nr:hypothetical protein [Planctomycetota bacterium]